MHKEDFTKLYTKQDIDESIASFTNEIGFSLIRNYPKNSLFFKDGKRMFIKVALLKDKLFFSVDMTKPEQREGEPISYVIKGGEEYKKKTTNFISDNQEPFIFDESTSKIIYQPKNKSFSVNEFVEILILNHLSDRMFFKRISNSIVEGFLKILFWLSDKHYEKIRVSIDKYNIGINNQPIKEDEKGTEPFFKYFYIPKNTIFALLLLTFVLAIASLFLPESVKNIWLFGEFSLSNPFVILFFFLILFLCEKFSVSLNNKIIEFFKKNESFQIKKVNFIERLHDYQYKNKFKLKLK